MQNGIVLRALNLVPLLWGVGCFVGLAAPEEKSNWPTEPDSVYISCGEVSAQYAEDGVLVFYNSFGKEIARDEDGSVSFLISPHTSSGHKTCGVPISVGNNGTWGLVMPDGTLFADRMFENISAIYNDVLVYSQDGASGLINRTDQILVAPTYDHIYWNGDGMFRVEHKGQIFLLDRTGKSFGIENDPDYSVSYKQKLARRDAYLACPDGTKRKSKGGKWGLVDDHDNLILPFDYRAVSCFNDGIAMVPDDASREWCAVGPGGTHKENFECISAYHFVNISHHYPEQLSADAFESSVLWNQSYLDYGEGRGAEPPRLMPDGVRGRTILLAGPAWRD